ncbi:MAG: amidohydrolase [Chitinophagaceae bacterium]|nr:amidohydrolase [Chitinophagaceae bacterium]
MIPGGKPLPPVNIGPSVRLSGVSNANVWQGSGVDTSGDKLWWTAILIKASAPKMDSFKKKEIPKIGKVSYPFNGYGWEQMPVQESLLIKNATVWTNEKENRLQNTDVLVTKGKIAQIGKNLSSSNAKVIDGTGKHLTPGIIDEHSHIAASSINEGAQSVTSEVRIADVINPEDINIYRQLSGGVTTSHILHGSANTVGGQTQLIKLRWGANDSELKFTNADPFIKFALGENVKRTTSNNNNRFPDTRMGVEEVLMDAFTRAQDYEKGKKLAGNKKTGMIPFRRDLELEALVEILNKKRFITCHSYVQSEITAALRIADKFGFTVNTLTHILEGYKVADKMKVHGANASTFSDWWNYKMEVVDAIPQNASLMQRVGVNVAINSDDAEMARRLNQEAAKSIKYAGMSEENALKMVTLNPAIMLHIDDKVGSIKTGKDADLVLWTENPLSIYAKAVTTIVDGIIYYDKEKDVQYRKKIQDERNRLIQKMSGEKKAGEPVAPPVASMEILMHCDDEGETFSGIIENNK